MAPTRDPFAEPGPHALDDLERAVADVLPNELRDGTEVRLLGATAGMRDLKAVPGHDRRRVDVLVVTVVLPVLLLLLRRPVLSAYLILTVVLGYLTTLGITRLVFGAAEGRASPGQTGRYRSSCSRSWCRSARITTSS